MGRRWCSPIEAVGSTSIELAPEAGLPEMVVLRGHVILEGFGFRGSRAMKLRPSRHGLNARSRALRDAARSSARQYAAQAARVARAREVERLGGCSGIESVAEVGERHVACVRRGEPRGEPSTRRVASTRRPILDEKGRVGTRDKGVEGLQRNDKKIFAQSLARSKWSRFNPMEGVLDCRRCRT